MSFRYNTIESMHVPHNSWIVNHPSMHRYYAAIIIVIIRVYIIAE